MDKLILAAVVVFVLYMLYRGQNRHQEKSANNHEHDITRDNELPTYPSDYDITNEHVVKEHFGNCTNDEWKQLSQQRCTDIKKQYNDPNALISAHCGNTIAMKERDAIGGLIGPWLWPIQIIIHIRGKFF